MDKINKVKNIFLSASIPLKERNPKFFETADVIAIRDAVIALASTVLANNEYHLIWGGHPSITPLITLVLERYGLKMSDRVTLYQSREFEQDFPSENEDIGIRVITEKKENRETSLLYMRQKMIGEHEYEAAIFIGGMEGVLDEYAMFAQLHPEALCFPIASTGAAARMLFEEHPNNYCESLLEELSYTLLFKKLLKL